MTAYNAANLRNFSSFGATYIGPVTADGILSTGGGLTQVVGSASFTINGNNSLGYVFENVLLPGTVKNNDIWYGITLAAGNITTPASPNLGDTFKALFFTYPSNGIRMSGSQVAFYGATNTQTSAGGTLVPTNTGGLSNFCSITLVCFNASGATSGWQCVDMIGQWTFS